MEKQNWKFDCFVRAGRLKVGDFAVDSDKNVLEITSTCMTTRLSSFDHIKYNEQGDRISNGTSSAQISFENPNRIKLVKPLKEILKKIEGSKK